MLLGAFQEIWCRRNEEKVDIGEGNDCEDSFVIDVFSSLKFRWPNAGKFHLLWWQLQQVRSEKQ